MTIKLEPVKSSSIAAVGYDAPTKTLAVRFANGGTYHYEDVPPEKHAALLKAKSIGGYFHRSIRAAHPVRSVGEEKP